MISQARDLLRFQFSVSISLVLLITALLTGCSPIRHQPPTPMPAVSVEEFLKAFRQFGGTIATLNRENPTASTLVSTVGTIGAYNLTQGTPACAGFVETLPSLVVELDTQAATMAVSFEGKTTSTLMVVDETGTFYCDENAALTTQPTLELSAPKAHLYAIYVGRTDMQEPAAGTLSVTIEP